MTLRIHTQNLKGKPLTGWQTMIHFGHEKKREIAMTSHLDLVREQALGYLEQKHAARERALPKSRAAIRNCANSIRATHRHEFTTASQLLQDAGKLIREMA